MNRHDLHPSADSTNAPERLLTYRETADFLGVTDRTVRTLVSTHVLPAVRFGGSVRIDPADLREFVENAKRERKGGAK